MDLADLPSLVPADLPLWAAALLVAVSAGTSFIAAAFGLGGGVVLLAVMATFLPVSILIPVHGVVQIGSNAGRTLVMARHIRFDILLPFAVGSVIGVAVGGLIAVRLPDWLFNIGLGLFLLWAAWGKGPPAMGRRMLVLGGAVSSTLTMFFGATGPFVAAILKTLGLDRMQHVGTFAACMVAQHCLKVVVFGLLGFAYAPWLPLIVAMIATGFIGTLIGRRVLHGLGDRRFGIALNTILTLLALRLIWLGAEALFGPSG